MEDVQLKAPARGEAEKAIEEEEPAKMGATPKDTQAPEKEESATKGITPKDKQPSGDASSHPVKAFLARKDIEVSFQRYAVDALGAMALGLFASLLMGTIFNTVGNLTGLAIFNEIGGYASAVAGPAMACAIGYALKCPPLVLFSLIPVGYAANACGGAGGPLAVLVIAIIVAELGKAVSKETKVDILVTPAVTVGIGCALAIWIGPGVGAVATAVGKFIMWATELQPFWMGIVVALAVGVALTLPISSAAICATLTLTGLAGGAALAGCCAQMVGFAVASFKDNGWSGVVSQGLGTSMLQMGNIMKKPLIWVPACVASAVGGPVATCVFNMAQNGPAIASGMGTCGLVGPIGLFSGWVDAGITVGAGEWLAMAVVCVILPAVVAGVTAAIMRKAGLIKPGDMKLEG